jgi:hypothetical protein
MGNMCASGIWMRRAALQSCIFIWYTSGKSSTCLRLHSESNMVCEAYRADAPMKHIVDQECQDMGKCSHSQMPQVGSPGLR